ncbi:MAG: HD-GYP domain-containing protein [Cyanobium sp.]
MTSRLSDPVGEWGVPRQAPFPAREEHELPGPSATCLAERQPGWSLACLDAILLIDPRDQRLLGCNAAMAWLCGYEQAELTQQPLQSLDVLQDAMGWLDALRAADALAIASQQPPRRLRLRHRSGHWLDGYGAVQALGSHDRPLLHLSFAIRRPTTLAEQASPGAILDGVISSLVALMQARDPYTQAHQMRVAALCRAIATDMGLEADQIEGLYVAALLHDIGKVSIGQELLTKPTRLKPEEFQLIKTHVQTSYEVLRPIAFPWPVATIAYQHHERLDGSGYPQGLHGDQILPEAQILALADTVESMACDRPYRHCQGIAAALALIETSRNITYNPVAVDTCVRLFREQNYQWPTLDKLKPSR